jgi:aspartate/glutamate racemase
MKKLACLHAHHSNIEYIDRALQSFGIEILHFVDPILSRILKKDCDFEKEQARNNLKDSIKYIAESDVDTLLITCTDYITLLDENFKIDIPILKIDEPFFEMICQVEEPQTILFTNNRTVSGTMERLRLYAQQNNKSIQVKVEVIEGIFELIMQGRKEEHDAKLEKYLYEIMKDRNEMFLVAQLSMVDAATRVENIIGRNIINPLHALVEYCIQSVNELPCEK